MNNFNMKLAAFEVRADERAAFKQNAQQHGILIQESTDILSPANVQEVKGCQAVSILGHSKIDRALFQTLKDFGITLLATRTVGTNHMDMEAAQELGITVFNANYDPNGVSEYTVMLMLMSLRKYKQTVYLANVNDFSLRGLQGRELKDLTVGIVGTGSIGAQVAKNLSGFGCKMLAYDRYKNTDIASLLTYVELEELYAEADIITYHVPYTPETHKMINKETLAQMKDGVTLINCARGELMEIPDLIEGIENEKIGALALDVFENETGIFHHDRRMDIISNRDMAYIRQFPNVILTHHIAFYTDAAVNGMVSTSTKRLVEAFQDK